MAHRRRSARFRHRLMGADTSEREGGCLPRQRRRCAQLGVLRERPDCDVVLHFQSKYATVVSCMTETPKDFNVTAEVPCHVGREIPVIPYFRPGSPELAEAVKAALKDHNSALMLKHGQVVCGKTFDEVFERAMFFEMACRIIVLSGGKYNTLTNEEIDDLESYVLGKKG